MITQRLFVISGSPRASVEHTRGMRSRATAVNLMISSLRSDATKRIDLSQQSTLFYMDCLLFATVFSSRALGISPLLPFGELSGQQSMWTEPEHSDSLLDIINRLGLPVRAILPRSPSPWIVTDTRNLLLAAGRQWLSLPSHRSHVKVASFATQDAARVTCTGHQAHRTCPTQRVYFWLGSLTHCCSVLARQPAQPTAAPLPP